MTKRVRLDEAYQRVKDLAVEMVEDGIPDPDVIDALIGVGANAYGKLAGPAHLAAVLRQAADEIETKGQFTNDQH